MYLSHACLWHRHNVPSRSDVSIAACGVRGWAALCTAGCSAASLAPHPPDASGTAPHSWNPPKCPWTLQMSPGRQSSTVENHCSSLYQRLDSN